MKTGTLLICDLSRYQRCRPLARPRNRYTACTGMAQRINFFATQRTLGEFLGRLRIYQRNGHQGSQSRHQCCARRGRTRVTGIGVAFQCHHRRAYAHRFFGWRKSCCANFRSAYVPAASCMWQLLQDAQRANSCPRIASCARLPKHWVCQSRESSAPDRAVYIVGIALNAPQGFGTMSAPPIESCFLAAHP